MFRLGLLWPTAAELSDRRYLGFLALHDSFFSHFSNSGLLYDDFHVLLIWSRVTKHFYSRISWDNGTSSTLQVMLGERILLGIAFLSNCEKWSLSPIETSRLGLELHIFEILMLIFIHTNHWKYVQEEFSMCTVAFTPHLLSPEKLPNPLTCVFCTVRQKCYVSFLLCIVHIQKKNVDLIAGLLLYYDTNWLNATPGFLQQRYRVQFVCLASYGRQVIMMISS